MNAANRKTFNPSLHFDVVHGGYILDVLLDRTLSFTLEDNWKGYDQITWRLDNRDGLLTDVKHLALGLLVRVRLGYASDTQSWRSFVISRLTGGVGVATGGNAIPAVGADDSIIEYSGRNRNAPDLRGRRGRGKKAYRRNRVTGRGVGKESRRFKGEATADILRYDNAKRSAWHGPLEGERRIFHVRHVSDAVREIALRHGYTEKDMYIETTSDNIETVIIPTGLTDFQFIEQKAAEYNWIFKENNNHFSFHSQRWSKAKSRGVKHIFTYGGADILNLGLDFDFRLPTPKNVRVSTYNPVRRLVATENVTTEGANILDRTIIYDATGTFDGEQRSTHLHRDPIYVMTGGDQQLAKLKAQNAFIAKHVRAMKINLRVVGNPDVGGGETLTLRGTGSPLVDGDWFIEKAMQVFSGTDYITEIKLGPPRKRSGGRKVVVPLAAKGKKGDVVSTAKASSQQAVTNFKSGQTVKRQSSSTSNATTQTGSTSSVNQISTADYVFDANGL